MRKPKKVLAILAALALLVTMLVPMATPAFAGTTYEALTVPTVEDGTTTNLGTLYIKIDPFSEDSSAIISLPEDYEVSVASLTYSENDAGVADILEAGDANDNEFKLTLDVDKFDPSAHSEYTISIKLNNVKIPDGVSGDIKVKIDGLSGQLSDTEVVVGRVSGGEVTLSVVETKTMGDSGTDDGAIKINIKENTTGALKVDPSSLKFKLPANFEWEIVDANDDDNGDVLDVTNGGISTVVTYTLSSDKRTLIVKCDEEDVKGYYRVVADVKPGDDAKTGDIKVSVSGESDATPTSLLIGNYADYGFTTPMSDIPQITAGKTEQEIAEVTLKEDIDGSLVDGRTVIMTLPEGVIWHNNLGDIDIDPEGGLDVKNTTFAKAVDYVDADGRDCEGYREAKVTLSNNANDGKAGKLKFSNILVDVAPDFSGDLVIKVSGSASIAGDVVFAKVVPAITATSETKDVKIGLSGQPAGDITITEGVKEALAGDKTLKLELPEDIDWDGEPTVEVTEGDLEIDESSVDTDNNVLTFDIDSDSTTPSTIKISNIKYKIDRSVVEGPITVKIKGDAVDEAQIKDHTTAAKVVNATVVTPAPGEQKSTVAFKINDTKFTVNGVEQTMDVAPYIKDGRTFLPVRYVAQACGVTSDNILFSEGKVTLIKGDKVIQLTLGSNVMLINGVNITMDVAAELSNDRTMLPFRWIAQALGATVTWDEATQTVTMTL